jgi:hypothetical protein
MEGANPRKGGKVAAATGANEPFLPQKPHFSKRRNACMGGNRQKRRAETQFSGGSQPMQLGPPAVCVNSAE